MRNFKQKNYRYTFNKKWLTAKLLVEKDCEKPKFTKSELQNILSLKT